MAKKINIEEKARISQGLSHRCSACKFRLQMLDDELVCAKSVQMLISRRIKKATDKLKENKQKYIIMENVSSLDD